MPAYAARWSLFFAIFVIALALGQAKPVLSLKESLLPRERNEDGIRHYVLDRDRLTLTAKTHEMGEDHERKLVWQRLPRP